MDSTTSDIPREIADVIIDLTIIKKIPTNHKLNVSSKTYVNADSKIGGFWRWWEEETGNTTVDYINKTIDNAVAICKKYPAWVDYISDNVSNISNALLNLEQVYKRLNQESTAGRIELIKVRINKDRFVRACKESESVKIPSSTPISVPNIFHNVDPLNQISSTPHTCNNCSKGTSPISHFKNKTPDPASIPEKK